MNILICGNYGAKNIGDEAIAQGMYMEFSERYQNADIRFLVASKTAFNTAHNGKLTGVLQLPFGVRSFIVRLMKGDIWTTLKAFRQCDLFVLGGGGLFHDHEGTYATKLWWFQTLVAHLMKKKVIWYGMSISPFCDHKQKKNQQHIQRLAMRAHEISLRDTQSIQNLKNILGQNKVPIWECQDAAFRLPTSDTTRDPKLMLIAFPKSELTKKVTQNWLASIANQHQDKRIMFINMDARDSSALAPNLDIEMYTPQTVQNALDIFAKASTVYAGRLHSLILAHTQGVANIYVHPYNHKVEAIAKELGYQAQIIKNP